MAYQICFEHNAKLCCETCSSTCKQTSSYKWLKQNFDARILTDTSKSDHVSPVLNELDWLPVADSLNGLMPTYLGSKLTKHSGKHESHSRNRDELTLPKRRTSTAQRCFTELQHIKGQVYKSVIKYCIDIVKQ